MRKRGKIVSPSHQPDEISVALKVHACSPRVEDQVCLDVAHLSCIPIRRPHSDLLLQHGAMLMTTLRPQEV